MTQLSITYYGYNGFVIKSGDLEPISPFTSIEPTRLGGESTASSGSGSRQRSESSAPSSTPCGGV